MEMEADLGDNEQWGLVRLMSNGGPGEEPGAVMRLVGVAVGDGEWKKNELSGRYWRSVGDASFGVGTTGYSHQGAVVTGYYCW
ncbi:hypothetical protein V6N13_108668 [Hibiscus sabdariffa]|uniref:Uncharacterized protein n=1 Tax=Hibiscus sabdariffa TaxID=183260 RepID=A0ABR2SSS7_9ROSI